MLERELSAPALISHGAVVKALKRKSTNTVRIEPVKARKPRISFVSSVRDTNMRQRLEARAMGPPKSTSATPKSKSGTTNWEEKTLTSPGPTSDRVFQLPNPPTTKPRIEDAFKRGLSSNQRDFIKNEETEKQLV